MRDIFETISHWVSGNKPFALATVIRTWGSSPRGVGSMMAVSGESEVAGSVSGGCIEGAVIEEALKALHSGVPRRLSFGVSDETAWSMGLSCGGKIEVFVEKHLAFTGEAMERRIWHSLEQALRRNDPAILLTHLGAEKSRHLLFFPDGSQVGDWGDMNRAAGEQALQNYRARRSEALQIEAEPVFVQVFPRKDRLIVIGAGHICIPLLKFARELDFETIVIDPRKTFAAVERFPEPPDQLFCSWPDEVLSRIELNGDTRAVLLTHDPKIDDPALHILLKSEVAYVGALGSRKTHEKRCQRLEEAGFSVETIARIRGPVGLDIGAAAPAEIALSIMAEIVQIKNRRYNT